jgi:hypothetical protein
MIIKGFQVYPSGTIRVLGWSAGGSVSGERTRGEVRKFSSKSLQRLAFYVAETTVEFKSMLTLTFPSDFSRDGRRIKKDLQKALRFLPVVFGQKVEYVWVLEFQRRDAPHFHILIDKPVSPQEDFSLCCRWAEAVTGASSETRDKIFFAHKDGAMQNIRTPDGAKRYLLKYALKRETKFVPRSYRSVGRFWGMSAGVKNSVLKPLLIKGGEYELREFLEVMSNPVAQFTKIPTYIFSRRASDDKIFDLSSLREVVNDDENDFQNVIDISRKCV